jgi:hypothetical protein
MTFELMYLLDICHCMLEYNALRFEGSFGPYPQGYFSQHNCHNMMIKYTAGHSFISRNSNCCFLRWPAVYFVYLCKWNWRKYFKWVMTTNWWSVMRKKTNDCIYKYANLLQYTQLSLLRVSTPIVAIFRKVSLEGYFDYKAKTIYKYKLLSFK